MNIRETKKSFSTSIRTSDSDRNYLAWNGQTLSKNVSCKFNHSSIAMLDWTIFFPFFDRSSRLSACRFTTQCDYFNMTNMRYKSIRHSTILWRYFTIFHYFHKPVLQVGFSLRTHFSYRFEFPTFDSSI